MKQLSLLGWGHQSNLDCDLDIDIKRERWVGLDIETYDPGLRAHGSSVYKPELGGYILGIGVITESGKKAYISYKDENYFKRILDGFNKYTGYIIGHNIFYDLEWIGVRHNVDFSRATLVDSMLNEALLDENRYSFSLENVSKSYGFEGKATSDLIKYYGKNYIEDMRDIPPELVGEYCLQDIFLAVELSKLQKTKLVNEDLLNLSRMENNIIKLLLKMRKVGVKIDMPLVNKLHRDLEIELYTLSKELGQKVDIWSNESVGKLLESRGFPLQYTDKGNISITDDFLSSCKDSFAANIYKQRKIHKNINTYIRGYLLPSEGRLRASFHSLRKDDEGTVSGRFSSNNPNLQNIPSRDDFAPLIRSAFIPEEGHQWLCYDYSQIELRFIVHYASICQETREDVKEALSLYQNPSTDFHDMSAELTGLPRKHAKGVTFLIGFGGGPKKLAQQLGCSVEKAEEIFQTYHKRMPFMKGLLKAVQKRAEKEGFVRTILNRRRRFTKYSVSSASDSSLYREFDSYDDAFKFYEGNKELGYRLPQRAQCHKALNSVIQGSAADQNKLFLDTAYKNGIFDVIEPKITVHDEIDASVPLTKEGEEAAKELKNIMENCIKLNVPVLVGSGFGSNWWEAK